MSLIHPFTGLRVATQFADKVLAPPYDVLNREEAHALAKNNPFSFLHVSKPEIDLPADVSPYDAQVYAAGGAQLTHLEKEHVLQRDKTPCFYLYQLQQGEHTQTGLVAAVSAPAYADNQIRKHELTRPDKENDRMRHIEVVKAHDSPVLLTYQHDATVDQLIASLTQTAPEFDVTGEHDVQHRFWVIDDEKNRQALAQACANLDTLYIADGHHRSAAAARVAAAHPDEPAYQYFLGVLFPDNQLQVLPYHRVIKDLHGDQPDAFLEKLQKNFVVSKKEAPFQPTHVAEWGMYLDGQWYGLTLKHMPAGLDSIASMDVSLLNSLLITPILGIEDVRRDQRIDFVGGIRGLDALERRVDSGDMAVAFSLYPTQVEQIIDVADDNEIMPPKSTWFEPKLADGLIIYPFEQ